MVDAVGHHPAGMLGQDGLCLRVVGIHQPHPAAAEQHALPGAVLRKAGVLSGADVVGGKVGEHPDVVLNAGDPVHLEPQAGHLHDAGVAARLHHAAQQPLEVAALGGGVVQRMLISPASNTPLVPISPTLRPAAVSTAAIRWAVVVLPLVPVMPIIVSCPADAALDCGQPGQRLAAVGHLQHRQVWWQTRHRPLTDNTRRARRGSLPGVGVAVGVLAGQTDKQSPRRHGAGIVTQGLCFGAGRRPGAGRRRWARKSSHKFMPHHSQKIAHTKPESSRCKRSAASCPAGAASAGLTGYAVGAPERTAPPPDCRKLPAPGSRTPGSAASPAPAPGKPRFFRWALGSGRCRAAAARRAFLVWRASALASGGQPPGQGKHLPVQEGHPQFQAVGHAHLVGLEQDVPGQPEVQITPLHPGHRVQPPAGPPVGPGQIKGLNGAVVMAQQLPLLPLGEKRCVAVVPLSPAAKPAAQENSPPARRAGRSATAPSALRSPAGRRSYHRAVKGSL